MTQPNDVQQYLAYLADSMRGYGAEQLAALEPNRRNLVLAARFDYDVRKGGFAQFLYNMQGELLGEVEDMLIGAKAVVAHEAYVKAIETCLADKAEYQRFLASKYTEENRIKDALHNGNSGVLRQENAIRSRGSRIPGESPARFPEMDAG